MRTVLLLICVLAACAAGDPGPSTSSVHQNATGCVSDPIAADGDLIQQCPPPVPYAVYSAAAAAATPPVQTLYPPAVVYMNEVTCVGDAHTGICWGTYSSPAGDIVITCDWDLNDEGQPVVVCTANWATT